jgi:hypothetical protein
MAQADAMETAKEVLRQMIKYRFWISIGIAALFATIAYMVGSGPIQALAAKETTDIKNAEKEVRTYQDPGFPTKEYRPVVEAKTQVVSTDVTTAWRTLYDRQAPLLTWPEGTQDRFQTWGPKWPEKVSPKAVELAIVEYIEAYPGYVNMVYKTFNPFDYETGEGVVAGPSEANLLAPVQFDQEHLPDLGKVWAAQERLWIQRTVLEVIADVNKNAKKWNEAVIRQVVSLEVGSPDAQDQRSLAKNETLEESKGIYAPGEEPKADEAGSAGGGAGPGKLGGMGGPGGMGARRGGGGGDSMGMMGGGGSSQAPESIFYVKADSDKYKVLPFAVTVLIDQDRVQDFLIELENSPMSIQVKDFELVRPVTRVTKPEKGDSQATGMMMGGMMGGGRMGGMGAMGMGGMVGMGGMAAQMMAAQQGGMRGGGMAGAGMPGSGVGGQTAKKKGLDKRAEDRGEKREAATKAINEAKGATLFDIYFDIVQVKVYGQARFFNAPPAAEPVPPSASESAAGAAAASGEAPAKDGKTDAKAAAAEKGDAPKAGAAVAPDSKDSGPAAKPAAPDAKEPAEKAKDSDEATEEGKAAAPDTKAGAAKAGAADTKADAAKGAAPDTKSGAAKPGAPDTKAGEAPSKGAAAKS